MAKILAKKCSGKLYEGTERLRRPVLRQRKSKNCTGEGAKEGRKGL